MSEVQLRYIIKNISELKCRKINIYYIIIIIYIINWSADHSMNYLANKMKKVEVLSCVI